MLTWKDVIKFATNGNPKPDRRVDKTEAEWREILTPEQFRITRKKVRKQLIQEHYVAFMKQENTIVFVATRRCLIQQ